MTLSYLFYSGHSYLIFEDVNLGLLAPPWCELHIFRALWGLEIFNCKSAIPDLLAFPWGGPVILLLTLLPPPLLPHPLPVLLVTSLTRQRVFVTPFSRTNYI